MVLYIRFLHYLFFGSVSHRRLYLAPLPMILFRSPSYYPYHQQHQQQQQHHRRMFHSKILSRIHFRWTHHRQIRCIPPPRHRHPSLNLPYQKDHRDFDVPHFHYFLIDLLLLLLLPMSRCYHFHNHHRLLLQFCFHHGIKLLHHCYSYYY